IGLHPGPFSGRQDDGNTLTHRPRLMFWGDAHRDEAPSCHEWACGSRGLLGCGFVGKEFERRFGNGEQVG
ncbi:MAG: hypothetical protein B7Z73_08850, partial [Planctomycetia bacterium 21-64-5]